MKRNSFIYQFVKKVEHPADNIVWEFLNDIFCLISISYGSLVYKVLRKKYKDTTLLVAPLMSIGDLLYLKVGLSSILEQTQIKDYKIVMNKRCERNARLIGFENVILLSVWSVVALNMYVHFQKEHIQNAMGVYYWCVFDMKYASKKVKMLPPLFETNIKEIEEQFEKIGAKRKKTVIISPYEQTLTSNGYKLIPWDFWERLVEGLVERGYYVLTNCKGDETEPPIEGTKSIFPICTEVRDYVSYAGGLIAIRSGFVDFACNADAKKVVLYPRENFFKTNEMGMSDDVIELDYATISLENIDILRDRIMQEFPGVIEC